LSPAHTIQNRQSHLAQACFALRATRRWAITGTPIQNKLADFASIVQFLQVYPYSDQRTFETDISKPWQRSDPDGFLRLKTLVRSITISRTKAVVNLPPRNDQIHHLEFTPEERARYDLVRSQTASVLGAAISFRKNPESLAVNPLQRLNALRRICNHGLVAQESEVVEDLQIQLRTTNTSKDSDAQESLQDIFESGATTCTECGRDLSGSVPDSMLLPIEVVPAERFDWDCEACNPKSESIPSSPLPCDRSLLNTGAQTRDDAASPMSQIYEDVTESMSTKVKALVADLQQNCHKEKRYVRGTLMNDARTHFP
jgi:SWI/SNF-related matrix-associated actin-dependent regulator of chromatin subfamily A3